MGVACGTHGRKKKDDIRLFWGEERRVGLSGTGQALV